MIAKMRMKLISVTELKGMENVLFVQKEKHGQKELFKLKQVFGFQP